MNQPNPCPLCKDKGYVLEWDGPNVNYVSCSCLTGKQFAIQYRSPEKETTHD